MCVVKLPYHTCLYSLVMVPAHVRQAMRIMDVEQKTAYLVSSLIVQRVVIDLKMEAVCPPPTGIATALHKYIFYCNVSIIKCLLLSLWIFIAK